MTPAGSIAICRSIMSDAFRSPWAGKPATADMLVHVPRLVSAYYTGVPDPRVPSQQVAFGTSGHRGSALLTSFNEWHVLAITQAICRRRAAQGIVDDALQAQGN
jgi:phosphoglucomutase